MTNIFAGSVAMEALATLIVLGSAVTLAMWGWVVYRRRARLQQLLSLKNSHCERQAPVTDKGSGLPRFRIRFTQLMLKLSVILALLLSGKLLLTGHLNWAVMAATGAGLVQLLYLGMQHLRARGKEKVVKQLPEIIEIIIRGARVGLSIEESIRLTGREMAAPSGPVFRTMAEKLFLGQSLPLVLKETAARLEIKEFQFLAITLILQQQTGGQYSEILENLGKILRDRQAQDLRLMVATSEARASAKIVAVLTAAILLLIAVTNKTQFNFLLEDPQGRKILAYAVGSTVFGFYLISQLLRTIRR